jgi:ectoine hydroxylase-related dioxygenase (phytanoyl-CoA dioxygenase family)
MGNVPQTLAQFRRDGFIVARSLIDTGTLDRLAEDIGGVFGRRARAVGLEQPDPHDHRGISQLLTALFAYDRDAYLSTARQAQHLASVHRLGLARPVLQVVSELGLAVPAQSTRPVIHFMADSLRIEGGYHKTPIHQDWRSVQGSLDGISIWLPLYDVGAADYPLEIIPRSHLRGLLPSVDDPFGHRVVDGQVDESQFEPVPLRRGDAVFFSGFLVHRTGASGGATVRIAFSYRYNNAAEPSFVARNYPSPYVYRPDMRLLSEDFPTAADVRRVFGA